jgi:hypothetical protein
LVVIVSVTLFSPPKIRSASPMSVARIAQFFFPVAHHDFQFVHLYARRRLLRGEKILRFEGFRCVGERVSQT